MRHSFRTLHTVASGPEQSPEYPQCQVYLRVDLSNIVGWVTVDHRPWMRLDALAKLHNDLCVSPLVVIGHTTWKNLNANGKVSQTEIDSNLAWSDLEHETPKGVDVTCLSLGEVDRLRRPHSRKSGHQPNEQIPQGWRRNMTETLEALEQCWRGQNYKDRLGGQSQSAC